MLQIESKKYKEQGQTFHLGHVFTKVNEAFFDGRMERPLLRWSARISKYRMGSYKINEDLITINRVLDQPETPDYVIEFIMYHEMLHKHLGIKRINGRNRAHTKVFREYEKAFPNFEAAEAYLRELSASIPAPKSGRKPRSVRMQNRLIQTLIKLSAISIRKA